MTPGRVLVVGAGFAGATHAREIAERGIDVHVIDRRPHIAGNAYDTTDTNGVRVHAYGPHLFHTNNEEVVRWLARFGDWIGYRHRVEALLPDGHTCVPLPINRRTVNAVFGVNLAGGDDVRAFLATQAEPIAAPRNAAEYLAAQIGTTLRDLFFRPYTRKMWDLDLEDLDADVVRRIPLRHDDSDAYFPNHRFQLLPRQGYTAMVAAILDHPRIRVQTGIAFDKAMERDFAWVFNSMPIDEYFASALGPLPYRSIRFHHDTQPQDQGLGAAPVVNFTDSGPITRQTRWDRLPRHRVTETGRATVTREEPCDYRDNNEERYYPIKTSDGRHQATYRRYRRLAAANPRMRFIGRCGTYQYLDMHQVINQSLAHARAWLADHA